MGPYPMHDSTSNEEFFSIIFSNDLLRSDF